jgi:flavodoxin I
MKQVLVVYWSSTGNTQDMAQAVAGGARQNGAEVTLLEVNEARSVAVGTFDAVALGCPSMGNEVLDDDMESFVTRLAPSDVAGKPLVLFGSYDWGDGQWMRDWQSRMQTLGARLVVKDLICQLTPDDHQLERCWNAGVTLVG